MKATVLDLRRKMKKVMSAIDNNETVTLMHRGRKKAVIYPAGAKSPASFNVMEDPAFGMWKHHKKPVRQAVKDLRKPRYDL